MFRNGKVIARIPLQSAALTASPREKRWALPRRRNKRAFRGNDVFFFVDSYTFIPISISMTALRLRTMKPSSAAIRQKRRKVKG